MVLLGLALITGFRPLYFLLYFITLVSALAYIWAWLQYRGLEVEVESLSAWPRVGPPLQLRITVREKIGLPRIMLGFRPFGLPTPGEGHVVSLNPRGSATWTVMVKNHRRGLNTVGSVTVIASDPLGLLRLERQVGEPHTVMVYPGVVPLVPGMSIGSAALGDVGGMSFWSSASASASRIREYHPGDNLSHIHWPSTARKGQLMTKEFDSGGHNDVWVFLDLQSDTQAGSSPEGTEEYGVTVAASLAKGLIEAGQSVGLVTQGDNLYSMSPKRDQDHLWDLLTALALVKAEGTIDLTTLIQKDSARLVPGSTAVVIAPGPTHSQATIPQYLYHRGIGLVSIVLDVASFDGTAGAKVTRSEAFNGSLLIRRGDNLAHSLALVMDRLVQ